MIVPFWSWNLSDTTHVRSHTKFQLIWAINTAFTRGGPESSPTLTQMWSLDPLSRVKTLILTYRAYSNVGCYFPSTHPPMAHCRESGGEKEG